MFIVGVGSESCLNKYNMRVIDMVFGAVDSISYAVLVVVVSIPNDIDTQNVYTYQLCVTITKPIFRHTYLFSKIVIKFVFHVIPV